MNMIVLMIRLDFASTVVARNSIVISRNLVEVEAYDSLNMNVSKDIISLCLEFGV